MEISSDYEELFKILNAYGVKYLIVGAHAVMYYAAPRFTKDIDVLVPPEVNDPENIFKALKEFGAPLKGVSSKIFSDPKVIFQIGVEPIRIDILMHLKAIDSCLAWSRGKKVKYGKTTVKILSLEDLIKTKVAANRPQDRLDIRNLRKVKKK